VLPHKCGACGAALDLSMPAYWPSRCVAESEGLRRDGAWEHGVLQQRAAGEAPLHEPPHVSLLILLAPAQANTRFKDRQIVRRAANWGRIDPAQDVTTVPQVRCRGLGG
jgi:hypothetical protein